LSGRLRSIVTAGVIAGVTLVLYGTRLGPPPPLSPAEAALFEQAQSVASTGRDTSGRLAPLFFQASAETWSQPIPVYSTAAFLRATSTGEWGARFATVRVVIVSALLMYLVARRLFRREAIAIAASALLVLTPALFAHGREATDAVYALPFVVAWLYCLVAFLDRPRTWLLAIAGFALGLGVYSQPGAPITMAFLAALTVPVLWTTGHRTPHVFGAGAAAFALPLMLMVLWFVSHPDTYRDTMGRWAVFQAHIRFPLDGLRAFVNWTTLGMRASLYWGFFDPSWLFLSATDRAGALGGAAPFLLPMAVFLPLGISHALKHHGAATAVALIGGLVIAPVATSTFGEAHNIGQAMTVVPFAVLLAGFGIERILNATSILWRPVGLALLALVPIQFAYFYFGYFAV
jgi:4-amino-4-deoxy-L-arabinose transferase-like glycosyltransferase